MGVDSAGVREDPNSGVADPLGLRSNRRPGLSERATVGTDPQNHQPARSVLAHSALQTTTAMDKFIEGELARIGGRARNDIRETIAQLEQVLILPGMVGAHGKPSRMQRRPKTVSWPGEMMAHGSRVESRVDTTEEDSESGSDDVRQASIPAGSEFSGCRSSSSH